MKRCRSAAKLSEAAREQRIQEKSVAFYSISSSEPFGLFTCYVRKRVAPAEEQSLRTVGDLLTTRPSTRTAATKAITALAQGGDRLARIHSATRLRMGYSKRQAA
jgi:hypothetical protein